MSGLPHELHGIVERFDHVAVAVHDLRSVLPMVELLDGRFRKGGDNPIAGFRWVQFHLPTAGKIEYLQPLDGADEDNFLVSFLAARGEGVHHLTFKVKDLHAAIARAEGLGFAVVGVNDYGERWKEAFVHPKTASGVLIQFAQFTDSPEPPAVTLDDVLAGRL